MPHFLTGTTTGAAPSTFDPTPEQQAIIEAFEASNRNLQIRALAGTGKTSTIQLLANSRTARELSILYLAFNKRIVEEVKPKLPRNALPFTLNSVGHRVLGQFIGKRLSPTTKKSYLLMKEIISEGFAKNDQNELFSVMSDLLKMVSMAKSSGFVPAAAQDLPVPTPKHWMWQDDDEYLDHLPELPQEKEWTVIRHTLTRSITQVWEVAIDFADQIYIPTLWGAKFPRYEVVMIDEAQDLSSLNHLMLQNMLQGGRLVAVGDPYQAIYGFRGAHQQSMDYMQEMFDMDTLPLSTSFRCPKAVVRAAQWRAPHMNSPAWAKEGQVKTLNDWGVEDLPANTVIICRNNAPLYSLAIRLLLNGRFPQLVGNDIGKTLMKAMKSLGDESMERDEVHAAIDTYERNRLSRTKHHARAAVEDFCNCMRVFIAHGENLGGMIAYADHLINSTGPIKLMTIHKSKGLEWPDVFLLDKYLIRIDDRDEHNQENNILYVGQTRAKDRLFYIESDNFVSGELEVEDD